MKKLVYLLSIILVTTLMFSCEKDESVTPDIVDEGLITLAELDGQWYFDYYEYDDIQFDCGTVITEEYDGIKDMFSNLNFDIDNMSASADYACSDYSPFPFQNFSKTKNDLNIYKHTFIIISYNNNTLKLKLNTTTYDYNYLSGVITFIQ